MNSSIKGADLNSISNTIKRKSKFRIEMNLKITRFGLITNKLFTLTISCIQIEIQIIMHFMSQSRNVNYHTGNNHQVRLCSF